jgi:hypothetical protein
MCQETLTRSSIIYLCGIVTFLSHSVFRIPVRVSKTATQMYDRAQISYILVLSVKVSPAPVACYGDGCIVENGRVPSHRERPDRKWHAPHGFSCVLPDGGLKEHRRLSLLF